MGWTNWRLLANSSDWFDEVLDHEGAACYELGITRPRGVLVQPVYCGHTGNERQRMSCYGRDGSHLRKEIDKHLRQGWCIYYRSTALNDKTDAEKMERRMLGRFDYPWNRKLN